MHYSATNNAFYPPELKRAYEAAGTWPDDAIEVSDEEWQTYGKGEQPAGKQRGTDETGRLSWVTIPPPPLAEIAIRKRRTIEAGRKASEHAGIIHNGIRYAGGPSNRQALQEALGLADSTGHETFQSWKDSDGRFHVNHPVADVRQALLSIVERRGRLIAREGELNADIDAALDADDRAALEAVEWSEE